MLRRLGGADIAVPSYHEGTIPQTLRDIDYGFAEAATTYGIGVKVWSTRRSPEER